MTLTTDPTKRTEYSSDLVLGRLQNDDSAVMFYTDYVLWDSSTNYIVNNGLPTDADVKEWIKVLEARRDAGNSKIESAIRMCKDYIKEL